MPSLADLIEAHQAAFNRFEVVCDCTDELLARQQGRIVTLEDHDTVDQADGAERTALRAVIAHPAVDMSDVSTKAAYLLSIKAVVTEGIEPRDLRLLLRSLIPAIEINT